MSCDEIVTELRAAVKILYKNRNQHRGTKHFTHFNQVCDWSDVSRGVMAQWSLPLRHNWHADCQAVRSPGQESTRRLHHRAHGIIWSHGPCERKVRGCACHVPDALVFSGNSVVLASTVQVPQQRASLAGGQGAQVCRGVKTGAHVSGAHGVHVRPFSCVVPCAGSRGVLGPFPRPGAAAGPRLLPHTRAYDGSLNRALTGRRGPDCRQYRPVVAP